MNFVFFISIILCIFIFPVRKLRKTSITVILLIFFAAIVLYPGDTISSAKDGISLWLNVVIPSLLPFFIINDMLIALRVPENISFFLKPLARIVFKTSGYGAYSFIMSIFAGYPSGAKIVSQLIADKKISSEEGQKILTFSSTSGPLFIIGAVGTGMFGSVYIGYILFLSHFIGTVLNGIFSRLFFKSSKKSDNNTNITSIKETSKGDILSKAITNSLFTCGIIGGYIIVFSVVLKLMDSIAFFNILMFIPKTIFNISNSSSEYICIFIKSIFEISNGCRLLSQSPMDITLKLALISFIISFSGLSVIGQVSSIISNTGIKLKTYIIYKTTQGGFSALTCCILLRSNIGQSVFSTGLLSRINTLYSPYAWILLFLMLVMVLNVSGSICRKINH